MPGRKSTGNNAKRKNSYNAPAKRHGGGSGGKGSGKGLAKGGKGKKETKGVNQQHQGKYTKMRKNTQIRDQPFEYCVILHAETALPCPSRELEESQQQQQQQNGVSSECVPFDTKQIVSLGICVVHTPSGTICGRLQAFIRPPPSSEPLSQYCCDVLNVTQKDVDDALPLIDVLENAEGWIKRIISGRQPGDPDTVYEIKATTTTSSGNVKKVSSSHTKVSGGENKEEADDKSENDESDDEEECEEEEDEEEEDDDEEEDDEQDQNDDDNLPSTTHKIMLAADGITTIAAIFQGKQQFMDSIIHPEDNSTQQDVGNNNNNNNNIKSKKQFSYLNTLSDTIFSRWVDVRESFHRYFRVPFKIRLKLNEMLKEIGMSYQGRGRNAPDMALNVARLMIGSMKKGCIYTFLLECRTSHEQDKVRGIHIGNLTVGGETGGENKNSMNGETFGVLGEWKKRIQNSGEGPRHKFRSNAGEVSSLLAGNEGSSSSQLAVPRSKQQNPNHHQIDFFYGKTVFLNEVSLRWLLLIILSLGSVWNVGNKLFS